MKNYELRWHFSSAVGAQGPGLEHRIKRLTQAGITPPGNKELSAGNTEVLPWILLEMTFCCVLVDCSPGLEGKDDQEFLEDTRLDELTFGSRIHNLLITRTRELIRKRLGLKVKTLRP